MSPCIHHQMSVSVAPLIPGLSSLLPAQIPHPRPWGLASAPALGGVGQDIGAQLNFSFSAGLLPLFPPLKCKHSSHLTEASSPRQAGSSLWGLRLGHTQL